MSSPNEYKNENCNKNKKVIIPNNIATYKFSKSPNKVPENSKSNNAKKLGNSNSKILKTENPNRTVSHNKRSTKNINGKEVIRPNIAGLIGAYGIALIALNNYKKYDDKDIQSGTRLHNENHED